VERELAELKEADLQARDQVARALRSEGAATAPSATPAAGAVARRRERAAGAGAAGASSSASSTGGKVALPGRATGARDNSMAEAHTVDVLTGLIRERGLGSVCRDLLCVRAEELGSSTAVEAALAAESGTRWRILQLDCASREELRQRLHDLLLQSASSSELAPGLVHVTHEADVLSRDGAAWRALFVDSASTQQVLERHWEEHVDDASGLDDVTMPSTSSSSSDDDSHDDGRLHQRRGGSDALAASGSDAVRKEAQTAASRLLKDLFAARELVIEQRMRALKLDDDFAAAAAAGGAAHGEAEGADDDAAAQRARAARVAAVLLAPLPVRYTQAFGAPLDVIPADLSGYDSDDSEDSIANIDDTDESGAKGLAPPAASAGHSRQMHLSGTIMGVHVCAAVGPVSWRMPLFGRDRALCPILLPAAPATWPRFLDREERAVRMDEARRMRDMYAELQREHGDVLEPWEDAPLLSWEWDANVNHPAAKEASQLLYGEQLSAAKVGTLGADEHELLRIVATNDTLLALSELARNSLLPVRVMRELKCYIEHERGAAPPALSLEAELKQLPTMQLAAVARYVRRRYDARAPFTDTWQRRRAHCVVHRPQAFTASDAADGTRYFSLSNAFMYDDGRTEDPTSSEAAFFDALRRLKNPLELRCAR
jgi:hypothetical protein